MLDPCEDPKGEQSGADELQPELDELEVAKADVASYVEGHEKSPRQKSFLIQTCKEKMQAVSAAAARLNLNDGPWKKMLTDVRHFLGGVERPPVVSESSPSASALGQEASCSQEVPSMTEPKIGRFSGDVLKYVDFRKRLMNLVIDNADLTEAEKWQRFRQSLSKDVVSLLAKLPDAPESLRPSISLLDGVYNDAAAIKELKRKFHGIRADPNQVSFEDTYDEAELCLKKLKDRGHSCEDDPDIKSHYRRIFPSSLKKLEPGWSLLQMRQGVDAVIRRRADEAAADGATAQKRPRLSFTPR